MNLTPEAFIALGCAWLCLCLLCGIKRRFMLFLALVFLGLSMTSIWLSAVLKIAPLDLSAVILHICALICAGTLFLAGLFFARIGRQWRESRVEDSDV